MDNKINQAKIDKYSEDLAMRLLDAFYANSQFISGQEILNISSIKQVNLFSLKMLFRTWEQESQKLESPFFDYSNSEVQEAVENFKNTVSRHISVNRVNFEPIFRKAIADTLLALCSPYQYYLNMLASIGATGTITLDALNNEKKFTKVNQAILSGVIAEVEATGGEAPTANAEAILDKAISNLSTEPDDIEEGISAFSKYIAININELYLDVPSEEEVAPVPEMEEKEQTLPEPTADEEMQPSIGYQEELSLNDQLANDGMTLAEAHEQQKIESISKGITLNQRFMFVNVLFDGDVAKFNNTVIELDGLPKLSMAQNYLSTHFSHWNADSYEVMEFMSVLEKRYS